MNQQCVMWPVEETLRESRSPAWSSDGRWLAYTTVEMTRGGGGGALRLIVRPLAGGDSREIAPEGVGNFQDPLWANGDRSLIALARRAGAEGGWVTIDLETGEVVWQGRLPAGGQATPMTYRARDGGRQFVVIAAGGYGRAGTRLGDSVVAFALE